MTLVFSIYILKKKNTAPQLNSCKLIEKTNRFKITLRNSVTSYCNFGKKEMLFLTIKLKEKRILLILNDSTKWGVAAA